MKLSNEIKVAILTLVTLAVLIIGYNFLKGKNIFSPANTHYAIYDSVDGLLSGNPVQINGFNVGLIETIQFLPDNSGRLLVTFTIENQDIKLPRKAKAQITSLGIMGEKAVQLVWDSKDMGNYAEPGDTLQGTIQAAITETLTDEILPLKDQVQGILGTADSLLISVNNAVGQDELRRLILTIDSTLTSVAQISENLATTTKRVDEFMVTELVRFNSIMANVESITANLNESNQKVNRILSNVEDASNSIVKLDLEATTNKLNATMDDANKALGQVANIMEKVNDGNGSIGKLLHDDALYNNITQTSADLDKLFIDLRERPKRYMHFSLFGRKDKKGKKNKETNEMPDP